MYSTLTGIHLRLSIKASLEHLTRRGFCKHGIKVNLVLAVQQMNKEFYTEE